MSERVAEAEAAWITCARAALAAVDDPAQAAGRWAEALRIARLELPPGHPLLLPSLVQHARLQAEREPGLARRLLDEAIGCARGLERDVAVVPLRPTARSSLFHLRLEAKHKGVYALGRRRALRLRLARVVALLERLRDGDGPALDRPTDRAVTGARGASALELALACLPSPIAE